MRAIAYLCLLGQALAFADLLVVEHARCEAHGETVHASLASSPTPAPQPDLTWQRGELEASAHGHDHCALLALDRHRLQPVAPSAGFRLDVAAAVPLPLPASPPPARFRLYHVAPKNSPPLAG